MISQAQAPTVRRRPAPLPAASERWLLARIGGESFGLPVSEVLEIIGISGISRVKGAPFPVRGAVNLRGTSIPVMDLGLRLGLGAVDVIDSRLVVVRSRGRRIGLLVGAVERLASVSSDAIQPLPEAARSAASSCLLGVVNEGSNLTLLLDLERTLLLDDDTSTAMGKGL